MNAEKLRAATAASSTAWDVANVVYQGSPINWFSDDANGVGVDPNGVVFKPDGLKMYTVGDAGNYIREYNLSVAWDISTAVLLQAISTTAQDNSPQDVFLRADGLKMYLVGGSNDRVFEYDLSVAWDISTAVYLQFFSVASQSSIPTGVFFKPDGLKMYVLGDSGPNERVYEYDLSVAWDVTTAVYLQAFLVRNQNYSVSSVFFKPDGLKMYVSGIDGNPNPPGRGIYEYDLSVAWDVTTAVYLQAFATNIPASSFLYPRTDYNPRAVSFKPDGLKMYVWSEYDLLFAYDLSVAWDISTVSYIEPTTNFSNTFYAQTPYPAPRAVFFKPDGLTMYIVAGGRVNPPYTSTPANVYEYDLSVAWDIDTAVYLRLKLITSSTPDPQGIFFKPDGLKMYVTQFSSASQTRGVDEYSLSTAWNVSTATYLYRYAIVAPPNNPLPTPRGIFFRSDGLKMYVATNSYGVYEYDLSVAWLAVSAQFLQRMPFGVDSRDVFFKPDGLKMYLVSSSDESVYEYDLSVAWDTSTAVYLQPVSVSLQTVVPNSLFFRPNGLKMYVLGISQVGALYSYDFV
jgi:DNA-binding beta-propeller fold protein YncE